MADNVIQILNLNKFYDTGVRVQVLFDLSLGIRRGEFTAIIGPSGSGKTSLLNIIGLLDGFDSGEFTINGTDIARLNPDELAVFRNRNLGFIFQFHYLLPEFTALENVLFPVTIRKVKTTPELIKRAEMLMERIGIRGQRDKFPNQMSGGQQQRVAIARALMNKPSLILADEPTGNLDQTSSDQVIRLMREILAEERVSLVMVTHDREIALKSDRVIELVDGKLCKDITLKDKNPEQVREELARHTCFME